MGNISVQSGHLRQMIKDLVDKTSGENSPTGLKAIAESIKNVASDYLYKKISLPIAKKKDHEIISLRDTQLNLIVKSLGFTSFKEYIQSLNKPKSEQLKSLSGNYYSFVRRNQKTATLFKAPVRITETKEGFDFELKGTSSVYHGKVITSDTCLYVAMESDNGKRFFHVYKIGNQIKPQVIQGTFSGVSTSFDPIAGRCILLRAEEDFDKMKNSTIEAAVLLKGKVADRKIGLYFKEYQNNNASINKAYAFTVDDLDNN